MHRLAKAAIVFSSLTLAGVLIAYEGGYIPVALPGQGRAQVAPAEAQSPALLPSSKSKVQGVPMQAPATSPVMLSDSKYFSGSTNVNGGALNVAQSQPLLLPSSKDFVGASPPLAPVWVLAATDPASQPAPAPATTSQPVFILPSSKSAVITPVQPTVNLSSSKSAVFVPIDSSPAPAQPDVLMLSSSKSFNAAVPGVTGVPAATTPATSKGPATTSAPAASTLPAEVFMLGGSKSNTFVVPTPGAPVGTAPATATAPAPSTGPSKVPAKGGTP